MQKYFDILRVRVPVIFNGSISHRNKPKQTTVSAEMIVLAIVSQLTLTQFAKNSSVGLLIFT